MYSFIGYMEGAVKQAINSDDSVGNELVWPKSLVANREGTTLATQKPPTFCTKPWKPRNPTPELALQFTVGVVALRSPNRLAPNRRAPPAVGGLVPDPYYRRCRRIPGVPSPSGRAV